MQINSCTLELSLFYYDLRYKKNNFIHSGVLIIITRTGVSYYSDAPVLHNSSALVRHKTPHQNKSLGLTNHPGAPIKQRAPEQGYYVKCSIGATEGSNCRQEFF